MRARGRLAKAAGALGGAFWGFLFGLLFFIPLFGMAIGAAMGALAGSMGDVGIDDQFINEVREKITPGTSALFLMTQNAVEDKLSDALLEGQFGEGDSLRLDFVEGDVTIDKVAAPEPEPALTTS